MSHFITDGFWAYMSKSSKNSSSWGRPNFFRLYMEPNSLSLIFSIKCGLLSEIFETIDLKKELRAKN